MVLVRRAASHLSRRRLTGFSSMHVHRKKSFIGKSGGDGLAFAYRDDIDIRPMVLHTYTLTSFEVLLVTTKTSARSLIIANIYRSPDLSLNTLEELTDLVTHIYVATTNRLLRCGYFNCPGSHASSINDELNTVLSSLNLT